MPHLELFVVDENAAEAVRKRRRPDQHAVLKEQQHAQQGEHYHPPHPLSRPARSKTGNHQTSLTARSSHCCIIAKLCAWQHRGARWGTGVISVLRAYAPYALTTGMSQKMLVWCCQRLHIGDRPSCLQARGRWDTQRQLHCQPASSAPAAPTSAGLKKKGVAAT